jgi:hypothetical protein
MARKRRGGFTKAELVCAALVLALVALPAAGTAVGAEIFERVGTVAASYLTIEPDPRGEAFGGAYAALADGPSGVYWNPAGLAFGAAAEFVDQGFLISEIKWFGGMDISFLAGSVDLGFLLGRPWIGTLCYWDTRVDYEQGQSMEFEYDVDMSDKAYGIAYAHRLRADLAVGLTYKHIESEFSDWEGKGTGWDFGVAYRRTLYLSYDLRARMGAAAGVRNLGSADPFLMDTGDRDLPRRTYLGFAPTLRYMLGARWPFEVTLSGELQYDDPMERWIRMGGIEVVLLDLIAVRYGRYHADRATREGTVGLGVKARYGDYLGLRFDYSKTEYEVFGDLERVMLRIQLLNCRDACDLRQGSGGFMSD